MRETLVTLLNIILEQLNTLSQLKHKHGAICVRVQPKKSQKKTHFNIL